MKYNTSASNYYNDLCNYLFFLMVHHRTYRSVLDRLLDPLCGGGRVRSP